MQIDRAPYLAGLSASLLALALTASACSGQSSGGQGSGGAAGSGEASTSGGTGTGGSAEDCLRAFAPIDPTAVIDDIEDGDGVIAQTAGRNGSWWVVADGSLGGTIMPPSDQAPSAERIPGGHCGSSYAMRLTGQGFTDWGATLTMGFRYTSQAETIDASPFRGAMFWARVGDTNSSGIRVQFQDVSTRPEGGRCSDESGSPDACYNGFGTELLPIDTQWRLYKIDFSRTTQRDFGYRADALDTSQLYAMEWNLEANSIFDLWVDDVWFYE